MFDKEIFKSNVSEILARVSEKTQEEVVITDAEGDVVTIIAKNKETLQLIASALSEADYIVKYVYGCNFLRVEPNDCATTVHTPIITHIPLSFAEAIKLVKNAGLGVVEEVRNGVPHVTAVGTSMSHDSLTKIVYALCRGGISVTYYGCGNFFEFDDTQASTVEEVPMVSEVAVEEVAV